MGCLILKALNKIDNVANASKLLALPLEKFILLLKLENNSSKS